MSIEVCAIIVAYNNPKELQRLLFSLDGQGSTLNGLTIIDNSDACYAAKNKRLFDAYSKRYSFTRYFKTKANIGSAGGVCCGMKLAHQNNFDWVWLLDQDGVVAPSCLTELLRHADKGDILCPKVVDINRPEVTLWEKRARKSFFGRLYPARLPADYCQIHAFGTHGVLISRKVLDTIGYYDACNFFVGLEDYHYANRALQVGFVILLVARAEAQHPDNFRRKVTGVPKELHVTIVQRLKSNVPTSRSSNSVVTLNQPELRRQIDRFLPVTLGYMTAPHSAMHPCEKNRTLAKFSQFYFNSTSLTSWQYIIAFVYSLCCALLSKFAKRDEICLRKTLAVYAECLASNIRKEWHYGCIEEFCRHVSQ